MTLHHNEISFSEFLKNADEEDSYNDYVSLCNRYNPDPYEDIFLND